MLTTRSSPDFARAVASLARTGDDLYIEATTDHLALFAVNLARTAFARICFLPDFFDLFEVGTDSHSSAPITGSHPQKFHFKVLMRTVHTMFRQKSVVDALEKCVIRYVDSENNFDEGNDGSVRLYRDRLIVELHCRQGVRKIYQLHYQHVEPMRATFDKDSCPNSFTAAPKIIQDWLVFFSNKLEEVSISCVDDATNTTNENAPPVDRIHHAQQNQTQCKRVLVKSFTEFVNVSTTKQTAADPQAVSRRGLATEISVDVDDFDSFEVGGDVEVTFCLKDMKTALGFADIIGQPVTANFTGPGQPIIFSTSQTDIFAADFVLATNTFSTIVPTPPSTAEQANAPKTTPKTNQKVSFQGQATQKTPSKAALKTEPGHAVPSANQSMDIPQPIDRTDSPLFSQSSQQSPPHQTFTTTTPISVHVPQFSGAAVSATSAASLTRKRAFGVFEDSTSPAPDPRQIASAASLSNKQSTMTTKSVVPATRSPAAVTVTSSAVAAAAATVAAGITATDARGSFAETTDEEEEIPLRRPSAHINHPLDGIDFPRRDSTPITAMPPPSARKQFFARLSNTVTAAGAVGVINTSPVSSSLPFNMASSLHVAGPREDKRIYTSVATTSTTTGAAGVISSSNYNNNDADDEFNAELSVEDWAACMQASQEVEATISSQHRRPTHGGAGGDTTDGESDIVPASPQLHAPVSSRTFGTANVFGGIATSDTRSHGGMSSVGLESFMFGKTPSATLASREQFLKLQPNLGMSGARTVATASARDSSVSMAMPVSSYARRFQVSQSSVRNATAGAGWWWHATNEEWPAGGRNGDDNYDDGDDDDAGSYVEASQY
ncbi:cell cycle checkpoint control protein rad9a [Entophlyctis sp. JEL0112]|nr:cell cycle checkpoint control protein rad9a [Entophlyctis sp. JEL0112]